MSESRWESGDRVVHTARPEWGVGKVLDATSLRQDGKDVQRLTIRFDRAGTKTLSTAVAKLAQADSMPVEVMSRGEAEPDDPFAAADRGALLAKLTTLPEAATDPFVTRGRRLEATVALYRFDGRGGSLLDWAAAQTGMTDPLSAFSRHELEEGYGKFRGSLDAHLKKLVLDAAKNERAVLSGLGAKVPPEIRDMLTRALTQR
ncbi:MAG TPA: DUF3553 domain-containing protein [Phycisphaerales bacterium]|nr:DUF3553 domain-containing protein [Phycisphaerales bacterium]